MAYTLVIGTQNWSSWSLRPYVALHAVGAPFQTQVIRLRVRPPEPVTTRDEILKHSAAGKVPVLKIDENGKTVTVWDSLAICETLAERHPQAGLWPADPDIRAIARSYASEMHSGFPDLRDQLGMDFARRLPLPELRDETSRQVTRIVAAWQSALKTYKGAYLFGDTLGVADCMYAPVVSRFVTYGVEVPPIVQAYVERIFALPAMQEWGKAAQQEVDAGLMPPA
jgi:glutathione S-transferase